MITWLTEVYCPAIQGESVDVSEKGMKWIYIHSGSCNSAATAVTVKQKSTSVVWAVATKTYDAEEVQTALSKLIKANDTMHCRIWPNVFRNIQEGLPTMYQHSDQVCFPLSYFILRLRAVAPSNHNGDNKPFL